MDGATGKMKTIVEFTRPGDEGRPVDAPAGVRACGGRDLPRQLDREVRGQGAVEEKALERSTSLVLFRRLFGEHQEPKDGFPLDRGQGPPRAYTRGGVVSDFERQIWADFWTIANDESKAREMGIRAAHGQAVSIKAQKGKSYRILLRASDGLSIVPDGAAPPRKTG
ncbi:MAG: hypothetical protein U0935_05960 [Pirellulales bacterium]